MSTAYPFAVLGIGLVIVIGGIIVLRLHAFLSLITAAVGPEGGAAAPWVHAVQVFGSPDMALLFAAASGSSPAWAA